MRIISKPKKLKRSQRPPFFTFWAREGTIVEKDGLYYILRIKYPEPGYTVAEWDPIDSEAVFKKSFMREMGQDD